MARVEMVKALSISYIVVLLLKITTIKTFLSHVIVNHCEPFILLCFQRFRWKIVFRFDGKMNMAHFNAFKMLFNGLITRAVLSPTKEFFKVYHMKASGGGGGGGGKEKS